MLKKDVPKTSESFTDKGAGRTGKITARLAASLLLVAVVCIVTAFVHGSGAARHFDVRELRATILGFGPLAPVMYILIYTFAPALMLPGLPLTIAGGLLFGPVMGVLYTIIGATSGACVAFLVARYGIRGWVIKLLKDPRWQELDRKTARNGWKAVAVTRLIPLFPFNLLNFAFGLTQIPFAHYALATFVCMLPGTIAYVVFSSSLPDLLRGRMTLPAVVGIGLLAALHVTRKMFGNHGGAASASGPVESLELYRRDPQQVQRHDQPVAQRTEKDAFTPPTSR